jgi:hypothetical protein
MSGALIQRGFPRIVYDFARELVAGTVATCSGAAKAGLHTTTSQSPL